MNVWLVGARHAAVAQVIHSVACAPKRDISTVIEFLHRPRFAGHKANRGSVLAACETVATNKMSRVVAGADK